jgi:hypothetical protein
MSVQHSGQINSSNSSEKEKKETIACVVCGAIYTPSNSHEHLSLFPMTSLESAFMSMCHFCFRCRRPACPGCWDEIHGICGECVQQTGLPFRSQAAPLSTALFTVARQEQLESMQKERTPLICMQTGRFHSAPHPPVDRVTTIPIKIVTGGEEKKQTKTRPSSQDTSAKSRKPGLASSQVVPDEDISAQKTRPERKRGLLPIQAIERLLTILLLSILILILIIVLIALTSEEANLFFIQTLHVDIRAEIAYLWQLIAHLSP